VWNDPDNLATLTIENGETAGLWLTSDWANIDFGNPFSSNAAGPFALSSATGGSATLNVIDRRNSGPYYWNGVRIGMASAMTAMPSAWEMPVSSTVT